MAPRFVVRAEGAHWIEIRRAASDLGELVGAEEVDLNRLGHALAALVAGVRAAFEVAALPSLRLAAAKKALDLKTRKSALEAFVAEG